MNAASTCLFCTTRSRPALFGCGSTVITSLREVPVTTGATLGELVEVSGVRPGDVLVRAPNEHIKDGAKVTVAKKQ